MASALGLIRVVSNGEMDERDKAAQAAREQAQRHPVLEGLAKYVMDRWAYARDAKRAVEPRLHRARLARVGEYDSVKLAMIREQGGSEEYARVTANKCRIVESWLRDVFLGQTEKPWTLSHTPQPDFPPALGAQIREDVSREVAAVYVQTGNVPDPSTVRAELAARMEAYDERLRDEARKVVQRMERVMEDQMVQGGFRTAMADFIADFVTYASAHLKGPILRKRQLLTWAHADGGGVSPVVADIVAPEFERVCPFRIYPAPGAANPQDGYIIEHATFSYEDLHDLIGAPGFDEDAIRAVLNESRDGGLHGWLGWTALEHTKSQEVPVTLQRTVFNIDCLEFHGPVPGRDLLEWGLTDDDVDDPDASYEASVWLIGRWVIKAQLNYDPLGARPYCMASYEEIPGEYWGRSLPDVLDDAQGVVNAAVRSLVNNMAIASGPQVVVNIDRLPADEDITSLRPWKIWQVTDSQFGTAAPALDFFQPTTNVQDLLGVIEKFYQLADDFSLVPRYMAGSDRVGGAARTASGLSMLMDSANKGLKGVVANIDAALTQVLERLYAHNMVWHEDDTIKGDAQAVARGAVSLMQLEALQVRRNEFLQVTANPLDSQIVGLEGRAEILREVAKGLEMDVSKIIPQREQLRAMQQAQGVPPAGADAPADPTGDEVLANGAATTDFFSQTPMLPGT